MESSDQNPHTPQNDLTWLIVGVCVAVVITIGATAFFYFRLQPNNESKPPIIAKPKSKAVIAGVPAPEDLHEVEDYLRRGRLNQANQVLGELVQRFPDAPPVILLSARLATLQNFPKLALENYDRIPESAQQWYALAQFESGAARLRLGDFDGAELRLRWVLERDGRHAAAHEQLGRLLAMEGRRWEGGPHLFFIIRSGGAQLQHLILAVNLLDAIDEPELLKKSRRDYPEQWLAELGLAKLDIRAKNWDSAKRRLAVVLENRPKVLAAQVAWGETLAETGQWPQLGQWLAGLSDSANTNPLVWWLKGRWSEAAGQNEAAVRCYWESMRRYAGDRRTCHRLGQLLMETQQQEAAEMFLEYARQLDSLHELIRGIYEDGPKPKYLQAAAQITESLGRFLESRDWYRMAMQISSESIEARDGFIRLQPLAAATSRPVALSRNPAAKYQFDKYPLPDWQHSFKAIEGTTVPGTINGGNITFDDVSKQLGLDFRYINGDDARSRGIKIYQDFGGGLGVLDFDADGWPDLFAVQGNRDPRRLDPEIRDGLFRNEAGNRFVAVGDLARISECEFGQGVSIGDFNHDGFQDILIANIGQNRLLRNEGDGTFIDVTAESGLVGEQWSTSCVLADFNADGLDDIFVTNYLHGDEPFRIQCKIEKIETACRPTMFDPQPDQLFQNQGDGTFRSVASIKGVEAGRGLGVVAGDFDSDGRIDLFVANDMTANHLYWNETGTDQEISFVEMGLGSGVAFDRDGRSQACMGIAAGDLTGNGKFDLLVTNFSLESNTLYSAQSARFFSDRTMSSGLKDASIPMLGFGAQMLDADLDGWLDLVVTNGHIDQGPGIEFAMAPQLFRNRDGHGFGELEAAAIGDYFRGRYLGRALIRWDYNRDGKPDFAVSHLDAPLAVLENTTQTSNRFLSLELKDASRHDVTGAKIIVEIGDRRLYRLVTAGDGYMASNDRRIVCGLGSAETADKIVVLWRDGSRQEWSNVPADRHWMIIKGMETLAEWPREL